MATDIQFAQVVAKVGTAGQPGFAKAKMMRFKSGSAQDGALEGLGITTKTNIDKENEEVVGRNALLTSGKVAGIRVLCSNGTTASGAIKTARYTVFVPLAKYEDAFAQLPSKRIKGKNVIGVQGLRK